MVQAVEQGGGNVWQLKTTELAGVISKSRGALLAALAPCRYHRLVIFILCSLGPLPLCLESQIRTYGIH